MTDLTYDEARRLLTYDPVTGIFMWRVVCKGRPRSKVIGNIQPPEKRRKSPRVRIFVSGKSYLAHRLAWLMYYGDWPEREIDHKDGDATNNSISNLRLATSSQNKYNLPRRSDNSSGARGVYLDRRVNKWVAFAWVNGSYFYLGRHESKSDAVLVRNAFCSIMHGEYFKEATCSEF